VRSIKHECLHRVIPLWERHVRHTIREYLAHYHRERNHQRIGNRLIVAEVPVASGSVRCRQRIGGTLNYYYRAA